MANTFDACAGIYGGHLDAADIGSAFTLRPAAVMLVTETGRTDESNSPKRLRGAGHAAGARGSGKCGAV